MKNQLPNVEMAKVIPSNPQYIKEPSGWNLRKLAYIPLVIAFILEWVFSTLSNVLETIAKGFEEICVLLENFTKANEAKPNSTSDATGISQKT